MVKLSSCLTIFFPENYLILNSLTVYLLNVILYFSGNRVVGFGLRINGNTISRWWHVEANIVTPD